MDKILFIRTPYSFLTSTCRLEDVIKQAKIDGYSNIAIVDNNTLSGSIEFEKICKENNIKPIFGVFFNAVNEDKNYDLCLFAKDTNGYQNLLSLVSDINLSADGNVRVKDLNKYTRNNVLVNLSPSDVQSDIENDRKILGEYYVGLEKNDDVITSLYKKNNIGVINLPIVNNFTKDENLIKALKAIREKELINDTTLEKFENVEYKTSSELDSIFSKEQLELSEKIFKDCNVSLDLKTSLPKFDTDFNISNEEFLTLKCIEGLKTKLGVDTIPQEYVDRLKTEIGVIRKMKFEDYFLIVSDLVSYCHKNDIPCGFGRGSAVGSAVAYALNITNYDPIKNGLLFERFLNPERITMPDIDIDVSVKQRDKVLEYMQNRYGRDCVAHVQTLATLKSRKSLDDVARVLGYPPRYVDVVKDKLPKDCPDLITAYNTSTGFKEIINSSPDFKKIYELAKEIEGLPRDASTHASAIAIASTPLTETVSLSKSVDDIPSIEYNAKFLEDLGIIKFDILGLNTLDVIYDAEKMIKDKNNITVSYDDINKQQKTFDNIFSQGHTLGVFQFASTGMKKVLKNMRPHDLADLSAAVALYRPGPLAFIPEYINGKDNPSQINYELPVLEKNLKETYGVMIYQEQAMNISKDMAGFSLGKADILRKAMAKKDPIKMQELKTDFVNGSVNNGYSKEEAEKVFSKIESFASYGFNKSHAVAYADLAYKTAYLKANYPIEFYKSAIINEPNKDTKKELCKECENFIKNIKTPDIKTELENFIKEQTAPKERGKKKDLALEQDVDIPEPEC